MYVCICIYKYFYIYIYVYTGLEIGNIASIDVNHFWGNCESLWQSDSQNFFGTANHFLPIMNHFSNGFIRKPFFVLTPFLDEISPFLNKFYV